MNKVTILLVLIICVNYSCKTDLKPQPPKVVKEKIIKQFGYTLNDYHVVKDTVKSGDSFGTILEKNNLFYPQIFNIVQKAKQYANTVVITGGEPLMWNMDYITAKLSEADLKVHIETSGAYKLSGQYDWICLSPKKNKLPLREVYQSAHELKVIVFNKHDFKFAEEQAAQVGKDCELYLQPEWSNRDKMTPLIVDYVMEHPKWKISLQTHKYLNIP